MANSNLPTRSFADYALFVLAVKRFRLLCRGLKQEAWLGRRTSRGLKQEAWPACPQRSEDRQIKKGEAAPGNEIQEAWRGEAAPGNEIQEAWRGEAAPGKQNMCGRFALTHSWEEMVEWYDLVMAEVTGEAVPPPRYNIAPSQPIMMVENGPKGRSTLLVRWGLVPGWVKDPQAFTLLINARSETVSEKPSFRNAMRHRRLLVPATGFYEWRRSGNKSQAFWVRPRDGSLLTFAGLMETWSSPDGSEIDTGCLLTTHANNSFAKIHHRLPVIIKPGSFERWLDCMGQEPRDVKDLLEPVEDGFLEAIPVSNRVNKVANAGPDIQEPVEDEGFDKEKKKDDPQFQLF